MQKLKRRKALRVPLPKIKKSLCKSILYAVTNLELTSSRILSLLCLNCYTSIAGPVTTRMLSSKELHTQFTSRLLSSQNATRIACTEDFVFFKYTEISIASRGKRYFIRSLPVSILLQRVGPSTLRFSPHSISTQHREY